MQKRLPLDRVPDGNAQAQTFKSLTGNPFLRRRRRKSQHDDRLFSEQPPEHVHTLRRQLEAFRRRPKRHDVRRRKLRDCASRQQERKILPPRFQRVPIMYDHDERARRSIVSRRENGVLLRARQPIDETLPPLFMEAIRRLAHCLVFSHRFK